MLGHGVGDALLRAVALRLQGTLRAGDRISRPILRGPRSVPCGTANVAVTRSGGDEFVAVLSDVDAAGAAAVAKRIARTFAEPFALGERQVSVTASIGIAVYPDDGPTAEDLLHKADAAMYHAKAQGRNGHTFYSHDIQDRAIRRMQLESDLHLAIKSGEFVLHYQPKLDLHTGAVSGAEALLRWRRGSDGTLVSPGEFIPVAEESGLIVPMGDWILRTACAQTAAWRAEGLASLRVAVNLSAAQFKQPTLMERIKAALAHSGLPPSNLIFEITETMLIDDIALSAAVLKRMKDMGIGIAIDDFGTGYSSLTYLKQLPIDELKVDRSFVANLPGSPDDAAIVNATIALAHSLRLKTVAEGVESLEQLTFLREAGCDQAQGFLISRPIAPDAFARWLRDHDCEAAA